MAFSFDLRVYLLCDCRNLFLGFEWWQLKAIPSVLFGVNTGLTRARRLKHHPPVVFFRKRIQKDISAIHTVNNMNTDKKSSEIHISIRCLIKIAVKAKLFCPEIAGLFCRIAGLFCHDSRANLSLKPVCFGIAIS